MTANKQWVHEDARNKEKVDVTLYVDYLMFPNKLLSLAFRGNSDDFGKAGYISWFKVDMNLKEAESLAKQLQNFVDKYKEAVVK